MYRYGCFFKGTPRRLELGAIERPAGILEPRDPRDGVLQQYLI